TYNVRSFGRLRQLRRLARRIVSKADRRMPSTIEDVDKNCSASASRRPMVAAARPPPRASMVASSDNPRPASHRADDERGRMGGLTMFRFERSPPLCFRRNQVTFDAVTQIVAGVVKPKATHLT